MEPNNQFFTPTPPVQPGHPYFDPEGYKEKLSVRKVGNAVGLPLCMVNVGSFVLQTVIIVAMMMVAGFSNTQAMLADSDVLYLINAVINLVIFTVPFVITASACKHRLGDLILFGKTSRTKSLAVVMLGMGVCIISNIGTAMFSSIINAIFHVLPSANMPDYNYNIGSFILVVLCIGILPALLEEFAFRGVVLGILRTKLGDGASIIISAAFFGLVHGNFQQVPFAFGVGLVLGYATVYTGSMLPAILIHAINNTVSVVLDYATSTMSPMVQAAVTYLYFAVMLLIGICGFIILVKTDVAPFRLSAERTENGKRDVKWLLTSPAVIIYITMCLVMSVAALFIA
ncbi:MAG: CPBP family intramembrane metalloprotease [Clostridia bacterium]|nr:CPBP family intramembrane metalloprotease [Clostridia bacterium]